MGHVSPGPPFYPGRSDFPSPVGWAAAQPCSSGQVGTFGLSYPGAVQWLAAVERPPHRKAMVPAMTFSTSRNFIYSGGVFDMSWTTWIWENIAPDLRKRKNLPGPRTYREAEAAWKTLRDPIERRLPLSDLPEFRPLAPYLFEWMAIPPGDPRWDWMELQNKYDRVTAAVLNLSGWYDAAYGPERAVTNHRGLVAARAGAGARSELVLGPWIHGSATMNARGGQVKAGERFFSAEAGIDYDALILGFLDRHLKGADERPAEDDREEPRDEVVGVAVFLAVGLAALLGVVVPSLLARLGLDPAIANGPLLTTANDITSILIYFGLAATFLERFAG